MILVTGGTGYIGSHTCVALIAAGHRVTILDNLYNSDAEVVNRIEHITGVRPNFIEGDIRDGALLRNIFSKTPITTVMHFAGLKAVGESVAKPLDYYNANVRGTLELLSAMREAAVHNFIFSSSATVYGKPASVPIKEHFPLQPESPYGRSKAMVEGVLADLHAAEPFWNMSILRYFNPVGAHESGLIGEAPRGIPNNLMPYITQVAIGKRKKLAVFGKDYKTPDGTGLRDYIHVMDLAEGHVAALSHFKGKGELLTLNLGTGHTYSVMDMIRNFEKASGRTIPYEVVARRPGDVSECWADPSLAAKTIGWHAKRDLHTMCVDSWRWQQQNPQGFSL